jgi:hypothetical protein
MGCAIEYSKKQSAKKEAKDAKIKRQEYREAKVKAKSRGQWLKECQSVFNTWIRKRDDKLPCISCGRYHTGQYHAGHYRTTKAAPELRFHPENCWKQCSSCNTHLSGNITEYRINLVKKIGADRVEWLEGPHEPKKYTIEEIKGIMKEYKEKLKCIK